MAARPQRASLSRWLLVAVVGVGIVLLVDTTDDLIAPTPFTDQSPDLFIESGLITTFTETGSIDYRLSARRIDYFREDDTSYLAAPRLVVHNETSAPWQIDAKTGEGYALTGGDSTLRLSEDVIAQQERADGTFTRLTSSTITVFADRRIATSNQPVKIETDEYTLRAVGFETNLETGRIRLRSSKDQRGELKVLAQNG